MHEEIENLIYSKSIKAVESVILKLATKNPHIQIASWVNSAKHLRKR